MIKMKYYTRITRIYENYKNLREYLEAKKPKCQQAKKPTTVHFFQQPGFVVQPQIMCNYM